jgi:hypothetical protein
MGNAIKTKKLVKYYNLNEDRSLLLDNIQEKININEENISKIKSCITEVKSSYMNINKTYSSEIFDIKKCVSDSNKKIETNRNTNNMIIDDIKTNKIILDGFESRIKKLESIILDLENSNEFLDSLENQSINETKLD